MISFLLVYLQITSGSLGHFLGGWSAPWATRWVNVEEDALAFFKDEDSARVIFQIPFSVVVKVARDEKQEGQFVVNLDASKKNKVPPRVSRHH